MKLVDSIRDRFFEGEKPEYSAILWDIFLALRGPDHTDEKLKLRTTWRIRYWVGGVLYPHSDSPYIPKEVPPPDIPKIPETRDEFIKRLSADIQEELPFAFASPHFLGHYAAACWAIYEAESADAIGNKKVST